MNNYFLRLFILVLIGMSTTLQAGPLRIGTPIPAVHVHAPGGELYIDNKSLLYRPWSTDSLKSRVHILYYVAARMGADKINQPFLDALEKSIVENTISMDQIKIVSMLNINDVFPWGAAFAKHAFEENRFIHEHPIFVLDAEGIGKKTWQLTPKSCAVIITDSHGNVIKFKDGQLTQDDIEQFIVAIQKLTQEKVNYE